jgi:DNA-binding NarL/FixJ family response regulator
VPGNPDPVPAAGIPVAGIAVAGTHGTEPPRGVRAQHGHRQPRRRVGQERPDPVVLVLTTFDLDEYVYAGLPAGASGFLLKDARAADLVSAIHAVVAGDAVVAPSATRRLVERFLPTTPEPDQDRARALTVLTDRERQLLGHIARGLSNAEIAAELYLSEGTVKTYVSRILTKLDLRDRVQAVVLAYETGVVQPGDPG